MVKTNESPQGDERSAERGLTEREIGELFERLKGYDDKFESLDSKVDCILDGITGNAQLKGLAGHIRDLNEWKAALEKDKPLVVQLEEIRTRHTQEDEQHKLQAEDWRRIAFPVLVQILTSLLSVGTVIALLVRLGIIK